MKGKLDKRGELWILRAERWVKQDCRRSELLWCAHDCPHLGEPEAEMDFDVIDDDGRPHTDTVKECSLQNKLAICYQTGNTRLRLCHGTVLVFDEFTDERSGR